MSMFVVVPNSVTEGCCYRKLLKSGRSLRAIRMKCGLEFLIQIHSFLLQLEYGACVVPMIPSKPGITIEHRLQDLRFLMISITAQPNSTGYLNISFAE